MTKPVVLYDINLEHIADLAHVGIRRAAIFMGLGLNAAQDPDFKAYQLTPEPTAPRPHIELIGQVNDERVEEFKTQFAEWVIVCGLREVLEHLNLMISRIHHDAMVVLQSRELLHYLGDPELMQKKHFENPGIASRLSELRARFKIATGFETQIVQLYKLRNVFDHTFHTVTDKRLDDQKAFVVSWEAFEINGVGAETGEARTYQQLVDNEVREETLIVGQWVLRTKVYREGDRATLSRVELEEICVFVASRCIPSLIQSFLKFLEKHGVVEPSK